MSCSLNGGNIHFEARNVLIYSAKNIALAARWTSAGIPVYYSGTWALCYQM